MDILNDEINDFSAVLFFFSMFFMLDHPDNDHHDGQENFLFVFMNDINNNVFFCKFMVWFFA